MTGFQHTNLHDHVPIHRLNSPQTKLWLFGGEVRRRMAANLAKRYRSGVGVCSATLRLIAYVDQCGNIRDLPPPHKKYEMHQISNQPLIPECQCANFFDPEVQGPWRERGTNAHHPFCQFDKTSAPVFNAMLQKTPGRAIAGLDKDGNPVFEELRGAPAVRPDEALRVRESLK